MHGHYSGEAYNKQHMQTPYELLLGWRYTRAGRSTRRNGFISFISAASIVGIALGVAALIIVLSVMNGFQKEVRDRMLGVVSHIEVMSVDGSGLQDVPALLQRVKAQPEVVGAAPFVNGQSLIAHGEDMRGVLVRGIQPELEPEVANVAATNQQVLKQLQPGSFGAVLGVLHVEDAARIFQLEGPSGVRLKIRDLNQAPIVANQIGNALDGQYRISDWTQQNRSWFAAVQVEKRMMFIILTLIVAVAAFNLVSTLVMSVQDKRADIAILRTLGASPRSIMRIFMVQGATAGIIGTLSGLALGLLIAYNIDVIVPFIENLLQTSFLPQDIYLISKMPSDPEASDIVPIVVVSLILAFLATLYPSWRASRVNPAEALRYE